MSKARKNTAKKASKSSTALIELRAIVATMPALRAAYCEAIATEGKAETRVNGALPPQPKRDADLPAELQEVFDNITVAEFRAMPKDHPYAVWNNATSAAFNAAYDAYCDARKRLSAEFGLNAAQSATARTMNALSRAERKALKNRATGLEAIALKLQAIRLAYSDDDIASFDGLLATIDATARAAGFKTPI